MEVRLSNPYSPAGAAVMAVVSRRDYAVGRKSRARRRDLVSLCVFGASSLIINATLILLAALAG